MTPERWKTPHTEVPHGMESGEALVDGRHARSRHVSRPYGSRQTSMCGEWVSGKNPRPHARHAERLQDVQAYAFGEREALGVGGGRQSPSHSCRSMLWRQSCTRSRNRPARLIFQKSIPIELNSSNGSLDVKPFKLPQINGGIVHVPSVLCIP